MKYTRPASTMRFPFGRFELAALGEEIGFAVEVSSNGFPSIFHPVATIRGVVEGVGVAVQRFPVKHGWRDQAAAAFWPPLDLGLGIRLEGAVSRSVRDLFGSQDVQTGDVGFDRPMRIQADQPERARAILGPDARRDLLAVAVGCRALEVSDLGIRCKAFRYQDKDWRVAIPAMVSAARSLLGEARRVSTATALQPWVAPLTTLAAAYGLEVRPCPLAAEGTIGSLPCAVFFRRVLPERYAVQLGAVMAPPDPMGLWIAPRRPRVVALEIELAKPTAEPEEIATVDGVFDQHFVVRAVAPHPARVAASLPEATRRRMVELAGTFDVSFRQGVLSLRSDLGSVAPGSLRAWVDAAVDGVRAIVPNGPGGYRSAG